MLLMILIVLHLNLNKKITGQIGNDGSKDVQVTVTLKYLNNFWQTLEMSYINCEINIFLTGSEIETGAADNQ